MTLPPNHADKRWNQCGRACKTESHFPLRRLKPARSLLDSPEQLDAPIVLAIHIPILTGVSQNKIRPHSCQPTLAVEIYTCVTSATEAEVHLLVRTQPARFAKPPAAKRAAQRTDLQPLTAHWRGSSRSLAWYSIAFLSITQTFQRWFPLPSIRGSLCCSREIPSCQLEASVRQGLCWNKILVMESLRPGKSSWLQLQENHSHLLTAQWFVRPSPGKTGKARE